METVVFMLCVHSKPGMILYYSALLTTTQSRMFHQDMAADDCLKVESFELSVLPAYSEGRFCCLILDVLLLFRHIRGQKTYQV